MRRFRFAGFSLLLYLLVGFFAADRLLGSRFSIGQEPRILAGAIAALGLFVVGICYSTKTRTFFGFSRIQWTLAAPMALVLGAVVRHVTL